MRKFTLLIFSIIVGLSMMSCGDDTGVNIIDTGNGEDDVEGTIYSITFDVAGGDSFTFSVEMDGAVVEGDDLPDWFEGERFEFDPEEHRVFIAGSFGGDATWNQPGTNNSLRLSRAGRSANITVDPGTVEFKFFIVFDGMDFEDNQGWGMGEWDGNPNRSVEVASGGDLLVEFGDQPEVEPSTTPENLFMVGSGLTEDDSGWDWDVADFPMVPVHSQDMFWKIVWLYEGGEFKFAPQREWSNDFGADGEDPVDGITAFGGDNIAVPGETGYYMVVVNFDTEEIAVVEPEVYLIGETIGSWDTAAEAGKFDIDGDVFTITRELADEELRMYAWFSGGWFTDWWQSEFMIFDGEIEFRGDGDDQDRVNIDPAGDYTIELNFSTGDGSIEQQ